VGSLTTLQRDTGLRRERIVRGIKALEQATGPVRLKVDRRWRPEAQRKAVNEYHLVVELGSAPEPAGGSQAEPPRASEGASKALTPPSSDGGTRGSSDAGTRGGSDGATVTHSVSIHSEEHTHGEAPRGAPNRFPPSGRVREKEQRQEEEQRLQEREQKRRWSREQAALMMAKERMPKESEIDRLNREERERRQTRGSMTDRSGG
jgi:hypothetical protein